ncbi:MAG: tRNA (adenosine(37)-N6)-threonylcarbamoyltransferase complex ATPase subunit type 1 TsaE [Flavobacteriaceae bacterium]|nr:tRNA (adenosine(37)-N6)-threonylcarbamoyltransferase complex ATPase subunit type 1 TsaE [Flavobacteriaceae bacterium]
MVYTFKAKDLKIIGKYLIEDLSTKVVRIDGPMGAGKTTLISSICKSLGVEEPISSPTFSLVNTYKSRDGIIYHFDFYRIQNAHEALDIGLEEYLESGNLCFIEWAEKITPHLPLNYDHYKLEVIDKEHRKIKSKNS